MALIPPPGRSHMPRSNSGCVPQLLSLCSGAQHLELTAGEATAINYSAPRAHSRRSHCNYSAPRAHSRRSHSNYSTPRVHSRRSPSNYSAPRVHSRRSPSNYSAPRAHSRRSHSNYSTPTAHSQRTRCSEEPTHRNSGVALAHCN